MTSLKKSSGPVLADFPSAAPSLPDTDESPPPASEYVLESLQHWACAPGSCSSSSALDMCLVCQVKDDEKIDEENVDNKEKLLMKTQLPCGHVYHTGCISLWFACHCTCPTCRYELPSDDFMFELGREERMESLCLSNKPLVPPEDVWMPKAGCKQRILQKMDVTTSTAPAMYFERPEQATMPRTTSIKDIAMMNVSAVANSPSKNANRVIASSA